MDSIFSLTKKWLFSQYERPNTCRLWQHGRDAKHWPTTTPCAQLADTSNSSNQKIGGQDEKR